MKTSDRIPPKGKVWRCCRCQKINRGDLFGLKDADFGFDESCVLNAELVDEPKRFKRENARTNLRKRSD